MVKSNNETEKQTQKAKPLSALQEPVRRRGGKAVKKQSGSAGGCEYVYSVTELKPHNS